jgi:hypothetical protein
VWTVLDPNPSRHRLARLALPLALLVGGCGEDEDPGDGAAGGLSLPTYTAGDLARAQRGLTLDQADMVLVPSGVGSDAVTAERLTRGFGLLVLQQPYHNDPTGCPAPSSAARFLPRATAEAFLGSAEYRASGLSFDRVAVNVDLLNPTRTDLLAQCQPGATPRFDLPAHREQVVAAFRDLAGLPNLSHVTVGLDMNRYYHVRFGDRRRLDDYSNWITLYREVYDAIKAVNPQIHVGPGLSWNVFMLETVPEVFIEQGGALEGGRVPEDALEQAVIAAAERTVWPLLNVGRGDGRTRKADHVGLSLVQDPNLRPFGGQPLPAVEREALVHFLFAPLVADGLPVVLPQVDWEVQTAAIANNKATFLTLVKRALSHTEIEWAAWRRFSDVPELTGGSNPCGRFTDRADRTLNHSIDYCYAGLLNASGQVREVFRVLTRDP